MAVRRQIGLVQVAGDVASSLDWCLAPSLRHKAMKPGAARIMGSGLWAGGSENYMGIRGNLFFLYEDQ